MYKKTLNNLLIKWVFDEYWWKDGVSFFSWWLWTYKFGQNWVNSKVVEQKLMNFVVWGIFPSDLQTSIHQKFWLGPSTVGHPQGSACLFVCLFVQHHFFRAYFLSCRPNMTLTSPTECILMCNDHESILWVKGQVIDLISTIVSLPLAQSGSSSTEYLCVKGVWWPWIKF